MCRGVSLKKPVCRLCIVRSRSRRGHGRGHYVIRHMAQGVSRFDVLHQAGVEKDVFAVHSRVLYGAGHVLHTHLRPSVAHASVRPAVNAEGKRMFARSLHRRGFRISVVIRVGRGYPSVGVRPHDQSVLTGGKLRADKAQHLLETCRVCGAKIGFPPVHKARFARCGRHLIQPRRRLVVDKQKQAVVRFQKLAAVHDFRRVLALVSVTPQTVLCHHVHQYRATARDTVGNRRVVHIVIMA